MVLLTYDLFTVGQICLPFIYLFATFPGLRLSPRVSPCLSMSLRVSMSLMSLHVSPCVSMSLRVSNTPFYTPLRMVRTETRTQTTFDDEGRPVTKTVTERVTTEADGSETRQIVETED